MIDFSCLTVCALIKYFFDMTKPTVVFVNPHGPKKLYRSTLCTFISKANYIWQPQDFLTLSGHIPFEYDVKLLDCSVAGIGGSELLVRLRRISPVLLIVAISSVVLDDDLASLRALRAAFPGTRILVLGDVLLDEHFWDQVRSCGVDLVVNPMDVDLLNYIRTGRAESPNIIFDGRRSGFVPPRTACKTEKPKRIELGLPRHEAFISPHYRFPFMKAFRYTTVTTQYGCVFNCNYCSWSKIPVTYRGYAEVFKELDYIRQLGVRDIFFGDPSFGFPLDNAEALLKGIIDRKYGFRWACYTNPSLTDAGRLELMSRAGCHTAIIGVEDEDSAMLGSEYQRNLARPRLYEFLAACRKNRVRVCGDFIVGLNNKEGAGERMVDFAVSLGLDFASFNVLTPLVGSVIRDRMIAEGKLSRGEVGFDTSGTFGRDHEHLVELKNKLIRRFYLRPAYLLKRAGGITTWEEFLIQSCEMAKLVRNSFACPKGRR